MKNNVIIFDECYIETLSQQINPYYVDNLFNYLTNILSNSLEEINKKQPLILNYSFKIVNECSTYTETQNSSLDLFIQIKSPKLELSCINLNKNYFKKFTNKISIAWKEYKEDNKKNKKKKSKKQTPVKNNEGEKLNKNYTVQNFKLTLMQELSKNLTNSTLIYLTPYGIKLTGEKELGMPVNLFIVFSNNNNYKMFNTNTLKLIDIDFGNRYTNIDKKNNQTNNKFMTATRIFNGLYSNIMNTSLNQILIESILNNCPNNLFDGTNYEMLLKLVNYINLTLSKNFLSIVDENKKIYQEELATNDILNFHKFIKILRNLL